MYKKSKKNTEKIKFILISLILSILVLYPVVSSASFLSNIFSNFASASTQEILTESFPKKENLQNMSILEANSLNSIPVISTQEENQSNNLNENFNFTESALLPNPGLLRDSEVDEKISPFDQISVYVVRRGDTLSQIARIFGVSVNTIVWANDLKGKKISPGDTLIILPVSGIKHIVKRGDTLKSIASEYKVDVDEIIEYNGFDKNERLVLGFELIIPGGEIVEKIITQPKKSSGEIASNTPNLKNNTSSVGGYFIHPLPNSIRVRGLSRTHKGVDFAAPIGTPIYASASGSVIFAKNGWNGAYGNLVIISHSNGTRTLYAHLSSIDVLQGSQVQKNQVIGRVGNTGRSTGPHLHFEVLGANNPF